MHAELKWRSLDWVKVVLIIPWMAPLWWWCRWTWWRESPWINRMDKFTYQWSGTVSTVAQISGSAQSLVCICINQSTLRDFLSLDITISESEIYALEIWFWIALLVIRIFGILMMWWWPWHCTCNTGWMMHFRALRRNSISLSLSVDKDKLLSPRRRSVSLPSPCPCGVQAGRWQIKLGDPLAVGNHQQHCSGRGR